MLHVVQQWLSHTREAKNPIVAQSMRLDASEVWNWRPGEFLVFSLYWKPKEFGSNSGEGMPQEWDR